MKPSTLDDSSLSVEDLRRIWSSEDDNGTAQGNNGSEEEVESRGGGVVLFRLLKNNNNGKPGDHPAFSHSISSDVLAIDNASFRETHLIPAIAVCLSWGAKYLLPV